MSDHTQHGHPLLKQHKLVGIYARKQQALQWLSDNPLATAEEKNQRVTELTAVMAEEKAAHQEPNEFLCRGCKQVKPVDSIVSIMFAYVIKKDHSGHYRNHFESFDEHGRHRLWYLSMCEPCFDKLNLVEMPSNSISPQQEVR
jgi:hypothetical protein